MQPTIYDRTVLTARTLDPIGSGPPAMYTAIMRQAHVSQCAPDRRTPGGNWEFTVSASDSSAGVVVMIDGVLHQLTRQEAEDLDDLLASRQAKREGGGGLFEDLVRQLGLD